MLLLESTPSSACQPNGILITRYFKQPRQIRLYILHLPLAGVLELWGRGANFRLIRLEDINLATEYQSLIF